MKRMMAHGAALAGLAAAPAALAQRSDPPTPVSYFCQASQEIAGGTIEVNWIKEDGANGPDQYRIRFDTPQAAFQLAIQWYGTELGAPTDHEFASFRMTVPKAKRGTALQLWRYPRHVAGEAAMQGTDFPGGIGDPVLDIRLDELRALAAGRTELILAAVDKYRVAFKQVPVPTALFAAADIPVALRVEIARRSANYRSLCKIQDTDIVIT